MDLKEVGLIGADQEHHWYYAARARALRRVLGDYQPGRILDERDPDAAMRGECAAARYNLAFGLTVFGVAEKV